MALQVPGIVKRTKQSRNFTSGPTFRDLQAKILLWNSNLEVLPLKSTSELKYYDSESENIHLN